MRLSIWPSAAQDWDPCSPSPPTPSAPGGTACGWPTTSCPGSATPAAPTNEAMAYVAALAATVPRVRIGTLVCGNTYRHPAVLAKQAATVDRISGGRFVLGLGAGLAGERARRVRHPVLHGPRAPRPPRRGVPGGEGAHHRRPQRSSTARFYALRDAPLSPKPVQQPLPLLVGGGGERRTLRIAATLRRPVELLGDARGARAQGLGARAALRRPRARPRRRSTAPRRRCCS